MERTTTHDVDGFRMDHKGMRLTTITARVTKDELGATLSLADERDEMLLAIPLEPIAERLREVVS